MEWLLAIWVSGLVVGFVGFNALHAIRIGKPFNGTWFEDIFKAEILRRSLVSFKQSKTIIEKILIGIDIVMFGFLYFIFYLGLISFILGFIIYCLLYGVL